MKVSAAAQALPKCHASSAALTQANIPAHDLVPKSQVNAFGRRHALTLLVGALASPALRPALAEEPLAELEDPNLRPRNMMAYKPLVSQDFYFAYGVVPPRKFNPSRPPAQPQWNAWGSCVDTSCTYVPLKQRYDGYSKYSQRIERGFRGFRALKDTLKRGDWEAAAAQVELSPPAGTQPSPTVDMLLKAALLASQLLVSPNNLKEIQEAALARFYVNEASYALELISRAVAKQDREAALFAYDFGRDSWNSYISVVNRAIPEKVGDKFEPLPS